MKSILRMLGSFGYSLLISCITSGVAFVVWYLSITHADGFWEHTYWIIGMLIVLSWQSEKGVEITSIVYNWLWDSTLKTRIATSIPPIIVGIWNCSAPFWIDVDLTVGDIISTVVWEFINLFLYFNLISLPWLNFNMGRK